MLWKNWLIKRLGSLVIVAGPRQARFFHGPTLQQNDWKTIHALNSDHLPILLTIQTDNKHTMHQNRTDGHISTNYRKARLGQIHTRHTRRLHRTTTTYRQETHTSRQDSHHRQTPTTTHSQQNSTQKLDKQKHATRSQFTGAKQRDLHPHKHKQDGHLEGTHRKIMGPQKKHKHLLEHHTRTSP